MRAEAGCTQGDVDHAAHAFGLAVPAGIVSTTGIAGLTLGGGHGYLSRKYGLTIDNLLEADVVLADGRLVTARATQNEDLFWALRGGGGNFGVVTSFLYKAHPVSTVYGGPIFWELKDAPRVMKWYAAVPAAGAAGPEPVRASRDRALRGAVSKRPLGEEDLRRGRLLHRAAGRGRSGGQAHSPGAAASHT